MPPTLDDATTIKQFSQNYRLAFENYLMLLRKKQAVDYVDTETPLLPVEEFYFSVIDIGSILKQIRSLVLGPDSDDQGILRPTQFALNRVSEILVGACNQMSVKFPDARVAPDLDGGLRIEWRTADVIVRLVVPPKPEVREYIYVRANGQSNTQFAISGEVLATCLQKVM